MKFIFSAKTDIGLVRSVNQDYYSINPEKRIFIIADGMGGHRAGETASRIAADEIRSFLDAKIFCESDEDAIFSDIEGSIKSANLKIFHEAESDDSKKGMGTTVVAAVLCGSRLYAGWAGDSRAYIYRNGKIGQITRDHTYVQALIESGVITEEESFRHPHRSVITRAVGIKEELESDLVKSEVKSGDIIILCTDGATSGITADELGMIFAPDDDPEKIAENIILRALSRGGHDNSTVIVIKIETL